MGTLANAGKAKSMAAVLYVEYFDTDASSYTHRLKLPLKTTGSFVLGEGDVLHVQHSDGTTRFVPLANVKQYYEAEDS